MRAPWAVLLATLAACGINPAFGDHAADASASASTTTGAPATTSAAPTTTEPGESSAPTGDAATTTGAIDPSTTSTTAADPSSDAATGDPHTDTGEGTTTAGDEESACPDDPDLVACYRFPPGEYQTLVDDGPRGHDGAMVGVNLPPGLPGYAAAAEFNEQSRVTVGPHTDFNTPQFTVATFAFVKSQDRAVIDKDEQYGLFVDEGMATCVVRGPGDSSMKTQAPIVQETWLHLACTYDGGALAIHVHAASLIPVTVSMGFPDGVDLTTPSPLVIGRDAPEDAALYMGLLDHVLVFERALGADEVCALAGPLCP